MTFLRCRSMLTVLAGLAVVAAGCASHNSPPVQFLPCPPGQNVDCVGPDLVVQYPSTVTPAQLGQDMSAVFQTKAEVQKFRGAAVVADYPRHRLLVSWPTSWTASRQQALIQYLRSLPDVQTVTRI